MAITTPQGIDLQAPEPLELKTVRATVAGMLGISIITRYEGLKVYVQENQQNYQLVGGVQDVNWVIQSASGAHVIADNFTALSQRGILNFIGFDISDDFNTNSTIVTLVEHDPLFNNWLITTPPAYPADIPNELADLLEDSTHMIVTQTEKDYWSSKVNVEVDPLFSASAASSLILSDITNIHNLSGINSGDQVGDGVTITGTGAPNNPFVAVGGGGGGVSDGKVKLDVSDPTADYLDAKLQQGVQAVQIDVTNTPLISAPGLIQWNTVDGTYDMGLLNSSTLQVGQEIMFYGKSSGVITNGDVCQFVGVQGDHILFKKAVGEEVEDNTNLIIGVATENIADNEYGYVTWFGKINGIFTNTPNNQDSVDWLIGDVLYINRATGQMKKGMPSVPNRVVSMAVVIKEATGSAENGIIIVRPQSSCKLEDLDDVNGTSLTLDGQLPVWNNTNKYFDFDKNINDYLPLQAIDDTKGITGFIDGDNIDISYNYTNRTITLTGTLTYYWRGLVRTLTSPWTSAAHAATVGTWFLYSTDGINFSWASSVWNFAHIMVSAVSYGATATETFGIRETHKTMDHAAHKEFHNQIGTYKSSGGILTAGTYTENVADEESVTPGFDQAVLEDEDLRSTVAAWVQGTYTTAYVGPGSVLVFDTTKSRPFHDAGTNTYMQINDPVAGTIVAGTGGDWYNIYQVLVPACSDADSQKYRMIMLQPQVKYNSLVAAQGEDIRGLNLGNFTSAFTEFVIHARITYKTQSSFSNAGRCRIETGGITYITGSKASQVSVSGFSTNNHAALSNRQWDLSAHFSGQTTQRIAGFSASDIPETYEIESSALTVGNYTVDFPELAEESNWIDNVTNVISGVIGDRAVGIDELGSVSESMYTQYGWTRDFINSFITDATLIASLQTSGNWTKVTDVLSTYNAAKGDRNQTYYASGIFYYCYGTSSHTWLRYGVLDTIITTDILYLPKPQIAVGKVHGDPVVIEGKFDITNIIVEAETTTAGNFTLGSTGTNEIASLVVTAACSTNGNAQVTLGGTVFNVALTTVQNTATLVANALRAATYIGWTTGGTSTTVTFTSSYFKVQTDASYSDNGTGATGIMTTTQQGVDPNSDIITSVALPVTIGEKKRLTYIVNTAFPTSSNRTMYIGISSAASVKLHIITQKLFE